VNSDNSGFVLRQIGQYVLFTGAGRQVHRIWNDTRIKSTWGALV